MSVDTKDKVDGVSPLEELDGLLRLHRRALELDLRVSAPAIVLAFNPATRRADVQLAFLPVLYVDDEEVPQPPIVCPQVPVLMQGDATSFVRASILPGATGLVVFADRCLARFLLSGAPEDPINGRTHALGDGLFIPCEIGPGLAPVDPTAIVVEGPFVRLGDAASAGLVLDAGGAQAAITAAIATLSAITGVGPDGPNVEAIAGALTAVLSALVVSTKVYAAPAP